MASRRKKRHLKIAVQGIYRERPTGYKAFGLKIVCGANFEEET